MSHHSPTPDPVLKTIGLKKYFPVQRGFFQRTVGWIKAVDGVDLEIACGRTLGLVGESGCGKTTVGRLILKLMDLNEGRIFFNGRDITALSPAQTKPLRKEMQIIFQDPFGSLNPRMTVGQSVEEGLRAVGIKSPTDRKHGVARLLDMVGISPRASGRYPHEFSGGQRQRVCIARSLSVGPSLIICDEPISALDVSIQAQIINLLKSLQDELGLSYLFISHDLNVVGYIGDMVAVMYLGQIMEYAATDVIFEEPRHPYTQALLSAIPSIEAGASKTMKVLMGDVPSPFNPPPGCKFQGRCPLVEQRCREGEIEAGYISETHLVRCWKAAEPVSGGL